MDRLQSFYRLSAALTGFNTAELTGTGVGENYYDVLCQIVDESIVQQLLKTWQEIAANDSACDFDEKLRTQILANAKLGPVARNIIKLWYLSIWYPLPDEWRSQYGKVSQAPQKYQDVQFVVSENAYIQGLVWKAVGSHPMGAKQPGYGTWAEQPADLIASS